MAESLGTNITLKREGSKAILEIDLDKTFGRSKSGKSETIASTNGNITIPGTNVKLGLNAYK